MTAYTESISPQKASSLGGQSFKQHSYVTTSMFPHFDKRVENYMRTREIRKDVIESMALPKNTGHSVFVNTNKSFFKELKCKESKI